MIFEYGLLCGKGPLVESFDLNIPYHPTKYILVLSTFFSTYRLFGIRLGYKQEKNLLILVTIVFFLVETLQIETWKYIFTVLITNSFHNRKVSCPRRKYSDIPRGQRVILLLNQTQRKNRSGIQSLFEEIKMYTCWCTMYR